MKERWYYALLALKLPDAQDINNKMNKVLADPANATDLERKVTFMLQQTNIETWRVTYQTVQYVVVFGAFKGYLKDVLDTYYPDYIIIGAWNLNGLYVGTSYDVDGNVTGTPLYPLPANVFKLFPKKPVFDVNGVKIADRDFVARDILLFCGMSPPAEWKIAV